MGAVFYIPDFMEIQTPRAFPNCPGQWRDNPEDAGDFSRGVGRLPRYAPAHFCRGTALFSPQSRWEWETQKLPSKKKGGSSVLYSGFHGNSNPKGFPKLPGAMAGQSGRRGRFFPRQGPTLPLCTGVFSERSGPVLLPNPEWDGKTKLPLLLQKVGVVFYIPDFMKIRIPRAFPNCPGQWRDNPESAKDFSPGEGDSPVTHRRIFAERRPFLLLNPAGNGKHKNSHRGKRWE